MVGSRVFKSIIPQRSVALGLLAGVSVVALTLAVPSLSVAQQQDMSLEEIFGVPADTNTVKPAKKKTAQEVEPVAPAAPEATAAAPAPDLLQPISPINDTAPDMNALAPASPADIEAAAAKKNEADALMESMFSQTPTQPAPAAAAPLAPMPPAAISAPAPTVSPDAPEAFFGEAAPQPTQPAAPAAPTKAAKNAPSPDIQQLLDESSAALEPAKIPAKPAAPAPMPYLADYSADDYAPVTPDSRTADIAPIIPPEQKPTPVVNNTAPAQLQQLERQAQPPAPPASLLWDKPGMVASNAPAPVDLTQFQAPEHTGASVMALPSLPSILVRLEFVPYTSALAPSTLNAVQQLAAALQRDPGVMIELQGFADLARKSSLDASRDIAARRAGNVAQALVDAGVAPERLRVNGVGLDFMPGAVRDRVDVVVVR